jgi:hypothetical protein
MSCSVISAPVRNEIPSQCVLRYEDLSETNFRTDT